jgi:hypothetical protein
MAFGKVALLPWRYLRCCRWPPLERRYFRPAPPICSSICSSIASTSVSFPNATRIREYRNASNRLASSSSGHKSLAWKATIRLTAGSRLKSRLSSATCRTSCFCATVSTGVHIFRGSPSCVLRAKQATESFSSLTWFSQATASGPVPARTVQRTMSDA